ncbi:MAG: DNA-binding protein [Bacteroidetes bacterium RIFCSPLOWO2_12_FULL_37_12]|nr:MAG: DNA-binding protein [Bacteroidetes bacterium RIFCSPLOWO2_12_FULL_37_12]
MSNEIIIPQEVILSKIYEIRSVKVMLDRDLAELYGVETKYLKRQVKRNIERFPEDFMFALNEQEFKEWRSQFVTSNKDKMGLRYAPYAFTEDGVAQLSTVLNSQRAINVNLQIIRLFSRMRKMLLTHKDLLIEMEKIRKKISGQDEKIDLIFNYLKQFIKEQETPRRKIGYRFSKDKE